MFGDISVNAPLHARFAPDGSQEGSILPRRGLFYSSNSVGRDILKRHFNTHGLSAAQATALSRSNLGQPPQACTNCAEAKQKCDRASPCGRCRLRDLHCEAPNPGGRSEPINSEFGPPIRPEVRTPPQDGVSSTIEALDPCRNQEMCRRNGGGSFGPVAFPSSGLQPSDIAHNQLEALPASDLDSPAHAVAAFPADTRATPGTYPVPSGPSMPTPTTTAEAIFSTGCPVDPWFYPFSGWDPEYQSSEPSLWEASAAPWLNALSRDNAVLGAIKSPGHSQQDRSDQFSAFRYDSLSGNLRSSQAEFSGDYSSPIMTLARPSLNLNTQSVGNSPSQRNRSAVARASFPRQIHFPKLLPGDTDIVASENFCHVPPLSDRVYEKIFDFFRDHYARSSPHTDETPGFPPVGLMNTFIQLYFEFLHPHVPILHALTFNPGPESWMLVLAVAAVGCHSSAIANQTEFAVPLRELLHQAVMIKVSSNPAYRIAYTILIKLAAF